MIFESFGLSFYCDREGETCVDFAKRWPYF